MSLQYQTEEDNADETNAVYEQRRPLPIYTIILIVMIALVFAAQLSAGLEPSIIAAGFDKPAFLIGHEYWRILTGAAVHGGLLHVGMNC